MERSQQVFDVEDALKQLEAAPTLSILTLSNPILNQVEVATTPAALAADLAHYRDLFSKLRFSYVEQVTKERFLRTICAPTPEFFSATENAEFEEKLKGDKASLKEKKTEVAEIIVALEEQGKELVRRHSQIQLQRTQLQNLPNEIADLDNTIASLRRQQEDDKTSASDDPDLRLSLLQTHERLAQRNEELRRMELEIEHLQASLPAKRAQVQTLKDEIAPIQLRKNKAVEEAQEARKRRAQGGMADELEERGRWLRNVETGLKSMLEV